MRRPRQGHVGVPTAGHTARSPVLVRVVVVLPPGFFSFFFSVRRRNHLSLLAAPYPNCVAQCGIFSWHGVFVNLFKLPAREWHVLAESPYIRRRRSADSSGPLSVDFVIYRLHLSDRRRTTPGCRFLLRLLLLILP